LIGLLSLAGSRFYLKHPWQLFLAVTGIALGVAVFVGVDLANDSARRAFELSEDLVLGRVTHQIVGLDGTLSNSVYRDLRIENGPVQAAPVIEDEVRLAASPERRISVIGIDPLEEAGLRGFSTFLPGEESNLEQLIVEPLAALVPEALANELDLSAGERLELIVDGRRASVSVAGTVREAALDPTGANLPIVMDIASAQELFDTNLLSRIDLVLTDAEAERIGELRLSNARLLPAESSNATFSEFSRAFRINLVALSLLALLVGIFLIYATMSFAIVQRREVFGVLRAVGVNRNQMFLSILLEAGTIGLVATLLGLVLGHVLATGLVDLTLATIGDLYFSSSVAAVDPSPWIYWRGLVIGVITTLVAALAPAFEASRIAPDAAMSRADLEKSARQYSRSGARLAIPVAITGAVLFVVAPRSLVLGFSGLFLVIVAGALIVPAATTRLMRLVEPATTRVFGIAGSLAVRGVSASLSRTGVATAALAVAVATVIGVGVMIGSFRQSLVEWLDATLVADVYLSISDFTEDQGIFDEGSLSSLESLPGIEGISRSQFSSVPTADGEITIRAVSPGPQGWGVTLIGEIATDALDRLSTGDAVIVSEPYAYRRELEVGDELTLPAPDGDMAFQILGIYRDYMTDGGSVVMSLELYRRHWNDNSLGGVGVYFRQDGDLTTVRESVRTFASTSPNVRARSNDLIRDRSLEVFDRTFRITEVLRVLAGLVAFLGLLSALLSIELERSREIAVLRALGLTPRQIGTLSLTQTGLLGLAAGLLAIPLGIVMAALLVYIINQRSFGWSMGLSVEPAPLALGVALAFMAALLAGVYPAARAGQHSVASELRNE
jgi:putative ABC transport system permease protein